MLIQINKPAHAGRAGQNRSPVALGEAQCGMPGSEFSRILSHRVLGVEGFGVSKQALHIDGHD